MLRMNVSGDKSISHRAIMLGSLTNRVITIENLLFSDDVLSTIKAMRVLGVNIQLDKVTKTAVVNGVGLHGLKAPEKPIDCGNSGTTMRLLAGILAAQSFDSVLVGDASLMQRPMARIAKPLRLMGAKIQLSVNNTAPIKIVGGHALSAIQYEPEVASAQVKSCVLLAGLYTQGQTVVKEKVTTRDHTERMFKALSLIQSPSESEWVIKIPGDISSAAFFMVAAAITPGSDLTIQSVGINPYRTGVIDILKLMGANITLENRRFYGAEPVADINIKYTPLHGVEVPKEHVTSAIDEFPALLIAAALAKGKTVLRDAKELRVKETDRIAAMAAGLNALGVSVEVFDDGLALYGVKQFTGGKIESFKDHRIAMAFKIASLRSNSNIEIDNLNCVTTSFPSFLDLFNKISQL